MLKKTDLHNFAEDNTITAVCDQLADLIRFWRLKERIQKHCLRIISNDLCDYETLLRNSNKPTMKIRILRILAVEIFKTVNEINPPYMKHIFPPKENAKVRQNDIRVKRINTSRQEIWYPKLKVPGSKNMEQPAIKYKIRNIFSEIEGIY